MAAWGTLCCLEEEQEVGKVGTHLSGMRHLLCGGQEPVPSRQQGLQAEPQVSSALL